MALHHARSGEVVSLSPLGDRLASAATTAIIKATQLEVIRVVLAAGKDLRQHDTPGEITVQCLEGEAEFHTAGGARLLRPGDFVHLQPRAAHSLRAVSDASLLVTICLAPG
ncbi:cupin domain-containing protein [Acidovorax sp. SUPP2825]|uniref:cupin domain-containing protein n=1 Tax=Acidovorax sp. SUPP2825 TaxID=2920879 RepID=UPI0023DE39BF|nr:cupin domain-containing protein [Acidovorax sp. SUPP2825]GKS94211.1 cupin domain-containing protein [Acidovorax sp. SUPP2825]